MDIRLVPFTPLPVHIQSCLPFVGLQSLNGLTKINEAIGVLISSYSILLQEMLFDGHCLCMDSED